MLRSVAIIVAAALLVVANWATYDRLIYHLSSRFPVEWAKANFPIGMMYVPKGAPLLKGSISRFRFARQLFFWTPDWINRDPRLGKLLLAYRVTGSIVFLGVFFVLAVILAAFISS